MYFLKANCYFSFIIYINAVLHKLHSLPSKPKGLGIPLLIFILYTLEKMFIAWKI